MVGHRRLRSALLEELEVRLVSSDSLLLLLLPLGGGDPDEDLDLRKRGGARGTVEQRKEKEREKKLLRLLLGAEEGDEAPLFSFFWLPLSLSLLSLPC